MIRIKGSWVLYAGLALAAYLAWQYHQRQLAVARLNVTAATNAAASSSGNVTQANF